MSHHSFSYSLAAAVAAAGYIFMLFAMCVEWYRGRFRRGFCVCSGFFDFFLTAPPLVIILEGIAGMREGLEILFSLSRTLYAELDTMADLVTPDALRGWLQHAGLGASSFERYLR